MCTAAVLLFSSLSSMARWRTAVEPPPATPTPQYEISAISTISPHSEGPLFFEGVTQSATEATPEIQALARALEYNVTNLFLYVRNEIDYVPTYGLKNGALGCLLAGRGSDWDQSALLIALLRASGYTADFGRALVAYKVEDLEDWMGVDTPDAALAILGKGGNAWLPFSPGTNLVGRAWVELWNGSAWQVLDPAFKKIVTIQGIDLTTASGYSYADFMNAATSGATVTADYALSINESAIRSKLVSYTTNLLQNIQEQVPNEYIENVVGASAFVLGPYGSGLPFNQGYVMATFERFSEVADVDSLQVRIQHRGIDETLHGYEIAGKRVTIFYDENDNYKPLLKVDGETVATGLATILGSTHDITILIDQPYVTVSGYDGSNTLQLVCGDKYLIVHDFESSSRDVTSLHSEALRKARAEGLSEESEAIVGGSMQITLDAGLEQWSSCVRLFAQLSGVKAYTEHFVGIMGNGDNGYFVDLPFVVQSITSRTGSLSDENANFKAATFFGSGLEHGMLEQSQGPERVCVSTIKLLQLNNSRTNKTFRADINNKFTVASQLTGYSPTELQELEALIDAGSVLVVPEFHDVTLLEWDGLGYVESFTSPTNTMPSAMGMIIDGGYNGGYAADDEWIFETVLSEENVGSSYVQLPDYNTVITMSLDPVDLHTGNYILDTRDLQLGGVEPRGLNLVRHYNSGQSGRKGPFGYGWTHSYEAVCSESSHGVIGLGSRQARDAAPNIVQALVLLDLLRDEPEVAEWVAAILAAKWGVDQLIETGVTIKLGSRSLEYTKMPDGSYIPPPGETASLEKQGDQFVLEERFGTRLTFNSDGLIESWTDADSNAQSFAYNADTNLQTVTDCYGRSLTFSYQNGMISSVTDSTGRSASYQYANDNLISYTDPDGHAWTYDYDDADNVYLLTALNDPKCHMTATNTYNSLGQVELQKNGVGNEWEFFIAGSRGIEQDPQGGQTIHIFDDDGRNIATADDLNNVEFNIFDGQGHVVRNIDPNGNLTEFQFDASHNLTNRIDALGHEWSYAYDAAHHLIAATDPLGNETRIAYDANHHLTNTVDALTNSVVMTYYTGGVHKGLPYTVTDPNGNITTYTYDSYGNAHTIARTDGGIVTNTWNELGDLLVSRDANGNSTAINYNNRRLVLSLTDALGNTISNTYNAAGLRTGVYDPLDRETVTAWTPTYKVASVTYPDNGIVSNHYDARDLLIEIVDQRGNTISNEFDSAGRRVAVVDRLGNTTRFVLDANGSVIVQTNALGKATTFVYDNLNRAIRTTDPLGYSVINTFDDAGRLVAVTDANALTTQFERDSLGRTTAEIKPDGVIERYAFDPAGNLIEFRNGLGELRTFAYDGMNRVTNETDAVGNSRGYVYDEVGDLLERHDPDGAMIAYGYDDLNRLVEINYPDASAVQYAYNEVSLRTHQSNPVADVFYSYDKMDRLAAVTQSVGGVQSVIQYAFDANGNRTNTIYPGGVDVSYTFDAADRLIHVTDWADRSTVYAYDDLHRRTGVTYPGTITSTWDWDDASRLTGIRYANATNDFIDRIYTRDGQGNITAMEINAGLLPNVTPNVKRLSQNEADELTAIQSKTTPGVQAWTEKTPAYDDNGNLTSDGDATYGFDYENRLVAVSAGAESVAYAYAGDGSRLTSVVVAPGSTDTTIFVLDHADPLSRPLAELDENGALIHRFIWGRSLVAQVEANGSVRYFHHDDQGSTIALTDEYGVTTDQWFYSPYGKVMARTGSTATPYQWIGGHGVRLTATGLHFMKARYYSSDLRRFASADPLRIHGGANLYLYANANPIFYVDPNGEFGVAGALVGGGVGAVVGAGAAWWRGDSIWAGAAGGAVAGALVGSGAAIVTGALGAGTMGAGGAIGTMSLVGASGSMVGNTTEQVLGNMSEGHSFEQSLASVDMNEQIVAGSIGAVSGAAVGGGLAFNQAVSTATQQGNQMVSRHMVSISEELMPLAPGSVPTIRAVQSSATQAIWDRSVDTANVIVRSTVGILVSTEIGEEIANPDIYPASSLLNK